jgi:hypothetical protein
MVLTGATRAIRTYDTDRHKYILIIQIQNRYYNDGYANSKTATRV